MIKIINGEKNPIEFIGKVAGICYNSKDNESDNIKRGIECLKSNHGRTFEYVDLTFIIDGYSAKVIRELYTHIIGTSRLQSSTRYVNYDCFDFVTPSTLDRDQKKIFNATMDKIAEAYKTLLDMGVKKEDASQVLPLAMTSKIVIKMNLRALIHLFETRECTRSYHEFRSLLKELRRAIEEYNPEWEFISHYFLTCKCDKTGYCPEVNCCGRNPVKIESL